jgi:hypothetical protein
MHTQYLFLPDAAIFPQGRKRRKKLGSEGEKSSHDKVMSDEARAACDEVSIECSFRRDTSTAAQGPVR